MDEFTKRLVHLVHSRFSWQSIYSLLKADSTLGNIYEENYLASLFPQRNSPHISLTAYQIDDLISEYKSRKIKIKTVFDQDYPTRLKTIYQPPWVLFTIGDESLLGLEQSLAVVGSRDATFYGLKAIDYLFPELIEKGIVIISGLAKGIDAHAHKTAIKLGGKTVAVIAGGFDHIYPKENFKLADYMMKNHLIISEYPPASFPAKWQFPMRNRIISGISWGTLVVEARKRSGSLITADYALNEGREVFAIPGSILTPNSNGVHQLIQQGAKLVKDPHDILDEWPY